MKTFKIPTINDRLVDFNTLFALWRELNEVDLSIRLDFSRCDFLRQNAVAFLGGLIRLVEKRGGHVKIDQDTLKYTVQNNLKKNNFLTIFGGKTVENQGNTISFRQDLLFDKKKMMEYLKKQWLGKGWVHISDELTDLIAGKVAEIYLNSFEHSDSDIGVFSCGQHYPKLNQLILSVVDFGKGIPANVKHYLGLSNVKASKTLKWAFQSGNTTKSEKVGRGLGLGILKDFVQINNGSLEVFSHGGYVQINKKNEIYEEWPSFFGGTLINIKLNCDESYYVLSGETEPKFLF